ISCKLEVIITGNYCTKTQIDVFNKNGDKTDFKVFKEFKKLDKDKSADVDGISPVLLNECAECLKLQFHYSSKNHSSALRNAYITPIFKKDQRNVTSNYRPISLTSTTCKVCEVGLILCWETTTQHSTVRSLSSFTGPSWGNGVLLNITPGKLDIVNLNFF
ncbi:unnamed protein product, partial [Brachionus calyciflorus]